MMFKLKNRKRVWKPTIFLEMLVIPALIVSACSSPSSRKYLTSVTQFTNLRADPNNDQSTMVKISYSQRIEGGSTPTVMYKQTPLPGQNNVPSNAIIAATTTVPSAFQATYATAANTIGYQLAQVASIYATTINNFNTKLRGANRIDLLALAPNQDNNLINQFHQALSNNLVIGNDRANIGFGISDIFFNFRQLTASTINNQNGVNTKPYGLSETDIYDVRKNNSQILNNQEIMTADSSAKLTEANLANRLVKLFAITDITVDFRFFLTGLDNTGVPSRTSILDANNPSQQPAINNLRRLWRFKFKSTLDTFNFQLKLQDMIAQVNYSINSKTENNRFMVQSVTPSSIQSIAPIGLYYPELSVYNGNQIIPNNSATKLESTIFDVVRMQNAILSKEQLGAPVAANPNSNPPVVQKDASGFVLQQQNIRNVTNSFIAEIRNERPVVNQLKKQVITQLPLTAANNEPQTKPLFIEDLFRLYFASVTSSNNKAPFEF